MIQEHEDWLIRQVLQYAKERNYTQYTSTLSEAWRISIQGISTSIIDLIGQTDQIPELDPDYDFAHDPVCAFGILEAKLHRERGISLEMFLGLFKYYKQAYLDLIEASPFEAGEAKKYHRYLERSFDRMEIAFVAEWAKIEDQKKLRELQEKNRLMTNEKNKFLTIVESLIHPAILMDVSNRILYLNSAALSIVSGSEFNESDYYYSQLSSASDRSIPGQVPREHCIGKTILDCYPWLEPFLRQFESMGLDRHTGESDTGESQGKRYFEVHISTMRDVSGKFSGKILLLNEITKRKRAEEEKAGLEEQLILAQKMEAVGRLAGGVANDFNNILAGINGYAEMIQASLTPENPLFSDVEEIRKAGNRAAILTGQLLAFGRKQANAPRPLDLNELLDHSRRMLLRILGPGIELSILPGEGIGTILADPSQIEQVLVQLALNAREAMVGKGKVIIETTPVNLETYAEKPGDMRMEKPYVMLAFSDTGRGMDAEVKSRAFEPYFTTRKNEKSAGLGLPSVYGIVQQNRGIIRLYSEPGLGTTIKVYLPVDFAQEQAAPPSEFDRESIGTETILLVEDEDILRTLAKRVLAKQGYTVWEAANGIEAVQIAEKLNGKFDLLVTDVIMPLMNGRELFERLHAVYPEMKTLFMSGYTEAVISHHGILDMEINFLPKPFTINSLLAKVRSVLDA